MVSWICDVICEMCDMCYAWCVLFNIWCGGNIKLPHPYNFQTFGICNGIYHPRSSDRLTLWLASQCPPSPPSSNILKLGFFGGETAFQTTQDKFPKIIEFGFQNLLLWKFYMHKGALISCGASKMCSYAVMQLCDCAKFCGVCAKSWDLYTQKRKIMNFESNQVELRLAWVKHKLPN